MNWVDTETKAILQREKELPLAPPKIAEFALVLGSKGDNRSLLLRAVRRINECSHSEAAQLLQKPLPITVNLDLDEETATLGQFELVCCDAVSAVIRSEVAAEAGRGYLVELLQKVSRSPEFQMTTIWIEQVPVTEAGQRLLNQFLGISPKGFSRLQLPRRFVMPCKKARIMKHWAARVGAQVREEPAERGEAPNERR